MGLLSRLYAWLASKPSRVPVVAGPDGFLRIDGLVSLDALLARDAPDLPVQPLHHLGAGGADEPLLARVRARFEARFTRGDDGLLHATWDIGAEEPVRAVVVEAPACAAMRIRTIAEEIHRDGALLGVRPAAVLAEGGNALVVADLLHGRPPEVGELKIGVIALAAQPRALLLLHDGLGFRAAFLASARELAGSFTDPASPAPRGVEIRALRSEAGGTGFSLRAVQTGPEGARVHVLHHSLLSPGPGPATPPRALDVAAVEVWREGALAEASYALERDGASGTLTLSARDGRAAVKGEWAGRSVEAIEPAPPAPLDAAAIGRLAGWSEPAAGQEPGAPGEAAIVGEPMFASGEPVPPA